MVNPGALASLQDLGRTGWRKVGVPRSGALEPGWLRLANALLGNEEDAADFIATFLILQFSEADARRLIMGASFIFGPEALQDQERTPALAELAARHSLPAQRFFNRLCMAYGKDPALYADAVTRGMLPARRANHCAYEYS